MDNLDRFIGTVKIQNDTLFHQIEYSVDDQAATHFTINKTTGDIFVTNFSQIKNEDFITFIVQAISKLNTHQKVRFDFKI